MLPDRILDPPSSDTSYGSATEVTERLVPYYQSLCVLCDLCGYPNRTIYRTEPKAMDDIGCGKRDLNGAGLIFEHSFCSFDPIETHLNLLVFRCHFSLCYCPFATLLLMEYSLHKSLKEIYCDKDSRLEVPFGDYRIDVVDSSGLLIEIQHGSLSAIKRKCRDLLASHKMLVVKPVIRSKQLIKLDKQQGEVISSRKSPKRGDWIAVFDELVYFAGMISDENLTLEFVLVDITERRYPGHGKRRWKRDSDFQVEDLELVEVVERLRVECAADLMQLLPGVSLPAEFDTKELADAIGKRRHIARRVAYSLREAGAIEETGKRGNSKVYRQLMRQ